MLKKAIVLGLALASLSGSVTSAIEYNWNDWGPSIERQRMMRELERQGMTPQERQEQEQIRQQQEQEQQYQPNPRQTSQERPLRTGPGYGPVAPSWPSGPGYGPCTGPRC